MLFQINELIFLNLQEMWEMWWLSHWIHIHWIQIRTQFCCLNIFFYFARLADQKSFSFFHWQLFQYLEISFSSPAYFFRPTARVCLQTRLSSSVDPCSSKRWVHQSDSIIETKIGFPIQVVVCVSFSSSVGKQIDSKSKNARLLKSLFSSETGWLNPSSFSNSVSRNVCSFFG